MAITFVAAAGNTGSSNNLTVNVPAGTANDDVMVMNVTGGQTITDPTGWTPIDSSVSGAYHAKTYYRVASSEPASYTVSFGSFTTTIAVINTYRGVDTTNPINAHSLQNYASASALSFTAITTTATCTVVGLIAGSTGTYSSGITTGYTQRYNTTSFFTEDNSNVAPGTQSLTTVTWSAAIIAADAVIALNSPAPAGNPVMMLV
jgi:hypothetical protein